MKKLKPHFAYTFQQGFLRGFLALGVAVCLGVAGGGCAQQRSAGQPSSALPAAGQEGAAAAEARPNVLLITADDLGLQVGAYGDTTARTPHLDRLASEGMRLDRAYVTQASCSPSRSSILTGLYPHQNGQVGLANHRYHMHRGYDNIASLLKENDYRTGIIGKLHVTPKGAFPFDVENPPGFRTPDTRDVRSVAEQAEAFFQSTGQEPFFLYVNYFDPHLPFVRQFKGLPKEPYEAEDVTPFAFNGVDTPEMLEQIAGYYNNVARLDAGVGMLLDKLEQSGQAENTMVIFVSDHGPPPPFVRAKTTVYEAGVRVPFLVRWPGRTAPNMTSRALVSTVDLLPTVLEAAGVGLPEDLPGRSLVPLLTGEEVDWRDVLFTEYTSHTRGGYYPRRAIRNERYKLIVNLLPDRPFPYYASTTFPPDAFESAEARRAFEIAQNPPAVELYDLKKDPVEFHNLAGNPEYRAIQEKMRARLRAWREQTDDPLRRPSILAAETWLHYDWQKDPK